MPDSPAEPIVRLRSLTKRFGGHVAVHELSLDVARGEILALLGPNGAGKTTTIRMLMGILSPTAGTATVLGQDCFAERATVMRHVGYLPDEPMFHEHLRGGEIVRFCGAMRGMPDAEVVQRTEELAARLDFAVLWSAGLFAAVHPMVSWLPVGLMGAAAAVLFHRTRFLPAAMLLHASYNFVVVTWQ